MTCLCWPDPAGTALGSVHGVAPSAIVHPVKVLSMVVLVDPILRMDTLVSYREYVCRVRLGR
jgi:hypothetical protein